MATLDGEASPLFVSLAIFSCDMSESRTFPVDCLNVIHFAHTSIKVEFSGSQIETHSRSFSGVAG